MPVIGFLGSSTPASQTRIGSRIPRGCASSAGSRARTVASSIAGRRDSAERFAEHRGRIRPAQGRCHRRDWSRRRRWLPSRRPDHSDRLRCVGRPGRRGPVASLRGRAATSPACRCQRATLAAKRLELLHEFVPKLTSCRRARQRRLRRCCAEMSEVQAAARALGLEVMPFRSGSAEDIDAAFAALHGRADALYVCRRAAC